LPGRAKKLKGDRAPSTRRSGSLQKSLSSRSSLLSTACTLPRRHDEIVVLYGQIKNQKPGWARSSRKLIISGAGRWGAHSNFVGASKKMYDEKGICDKEEKRKRDAERNEKEKRAKRAGTEALHGTSRTEKKLTSAGTYHHTEVRVWSAFRLIQEDVLNITGD